MNLFVNNNKTDFSSTEKEPLLHVLLKQKHFTYSIHIQHCCHINFAISIMLQQNTNYGTIIHLFLLFLIIL